MLKNFLRFFLFVPFFVLCFLPAITYGQDKIIAIVNNAVITQKELNDFLAFMRFQLSSEKEYSADQLDSKIQSIKQDLLEKLIEDKLILQEANKNGNKVEPGLIKARMLQLKKRYRSEEEFQRSLAIQGLTEADIEEKVRDQAAMYNIIDNKVKSQVIVSPSEITDFYDANVEEFKFPEQRKLNYIKTDDDKVVLEVEKRINNGDSLSIAAKDLAKINNLTVTEKEDLKDLLKEAVFKLKKAQVSEKILIDGQYYIFEITDIIPARQQRLDEAQDSIQKFLFEKKMQEKLTSWLDGLKKNSYINIISG